MVQVLLLLLGLYHFTNRKSSKSVAVRLTVTVRVSFLIPSAETRGREVLISFIRERGQDGNDVGDECRFVRQGPLRLRRCFVNANNYNICTFMFSQTVTCIQLAFKLIGCTLYQILYHELRYLSSSNRYILTYFKQTLASVTFRST